MAAKTKKPSGPTSSKVIRSLAIVVGIALLSGVSAKIAMATLNRKMGIDPDGAVASVDTTEIQEYLEETAMPQFDPAEIAESASSIWIPDWKATLCSIYVTAESDALMDSLPAATEAADRNTELQLLIELWAGHVGFEPMELERIWIFASGDTCFVDLPRSADWQGIVRTIESRFVSYTILFPFVAGEIVEGMEDGISVRGIASTR